MTTRARVLMGLAVAVLLVGLLALVSRDGGRDGRAGVDAAGTSTSTTRRSSTTTGEPPDTSSSSSTTTASTAAPTTSGPGTTASGRPSGPAPTAPAPPPTAPPRTGGLAAARVGTTRVAALDHPIAMAVRPTDGSVWIATKGGGVCRLQDGSCAGGQTVASVSTGGEQGLLGITFNGAGDRFYASYTNPAGDSRVDEFAMGSGGPSLASRRQIFAEDQPEANHNGGNVVWGPDGRLYLGLGDGGGAGDRHGTGDGNAQDPNTDLGKILRIDPTTSPPRVERWISGVRNPWRFTFDRASGDLWVADVGQNGWEEITYLPAGAQQGRNLGWRCFEGTHRFSSCTPTGGHTGPMFEYSHDAGCSITGGYVYRGARIPDLAGAYLFADYCAGELRALTQSAGRVVLERHLDVNPGRVVSFGQDAAGELYVLTTTEVLLIVPV